MTDDDFPERGDFQDALVDLIDNRSDIDGITTGWLLVRIGQDMNQIDGGEAIYAYNWRAGQPVHVTRGLIEMARTNFDERCRQELDRG